MSNATGTRAATGKVMDRMRSCIERVDREGFCDEACEVNKKVSSVHPYVATIKPGIVSCILDSLNVDPGATVLDPFCGSGTIAVESAVKGYKAACNDLNPVATAIQRVKFTSPSRASVDADVDRIRGSYAKIKHADEPYVPNVDLWFTPGARKDLARLREAIRVSGGKNKELITAALSMTVKKASKAVDSFNMEWRRPKFGAVKDDVDVIETFSGIARGAVDKLVLGHAKGSVSITSSDAKHLPMADSSVDVIITDPPYGSAIDYINGWKAQIDWIDGGDHVELKGKQIGGQTSKRSTCNKYVARHPTVKAILALFPDQSRRRDEKYWCDYGNYFDGMEKAMSEMHRVAKPGAKMVMRLGNNVANFNDKLEEIPTTDAIIEIAGTTGWKPVDSFYRDIDNINGASLVMGKWKHGMKRERYMLFTNGKDK
jgi:predicted RNA methylase